MIIIEEIAAAWDKEADEFNGWETLDPDEKIVFTIEFVAQRCAQICDEESLCYDKDQPDDVCNALMNVKAIIKQIYRQQ